MISKVGFLLLFLSRVLSATTVAATEIRVGGQQGQEVAVLLQGAAPWVLYGGESYPAQSGNVIWAAYCDLRIAATTNSPVGYPYSSLFPRGSRFSIDPSASRIDVMCASPPPQLSYLDFLGIYFGLTSEGQNGPIGQGGYLTMPGGYQSGTLNQTQPPINPVTTTTLNGNSAPSFTPFAYICEGVPVRTGPCHTPSGGATSPEMDAFKKALAEQANQMMTTLMNGGMSYGQAYRTVSDFTSTTMRRWRRTHLGNHH